MHHVNVDHLQSMLMALWNTILESHHYITLAKLFNSEDPVMLSTKSDHCFAIEILQWL